MAVHIVYKFSEIVCRISFQDIHRKTSICDWMTMMLQGKVFIIFIKYYVGGPLNECKMKAFQQILFLEKYKLHGWSNMLFRSGVVLNKGQ